MNYVDFTFGTKARACMAALHLRGYNGGNDPSLSVAHDLGNVYFRELTYKEPGNSMSRNSVWEFGDFHIVCFQGHDALNPSHTTGLLSQWGTRWGEQLDGYILTHVSLLGETMRILKQDVPRLGTKPLILAGHSYGGYWAQMQALMRFQVDSDVPVEVYTYGAPKTIYGQDNANKVLRRSWINRFIRDPDVVPNLPPIWDESWSATAAFVFQPRWSQMWHPCQAYDVGSESVTTKWTTTTFAGEVGWNVAAWLTEVMRGAESTHGVVPYWRDIGRHFQVAQPGSSVPPPSPRPHSSDRPAQVVNMSAMEKARRYAESDLRDRERDHASVAVNVAPWEVVKKPLGYAVALHGIMEVAVYSTRSKATKVKTHLNRAYKALGKSADIDQAELAAAMHEVASEIEGAWEA